MNNKEKERIMNLSMRYCTAFLGGIADIEILVCKQ